MGLTVTSDPVRHRISESNDMCKDFLHMRVIDITGGFSGKLPNTSSLKSHEHLGVFSHFGQKWENGMLVGEGETPQKQGGTIRFSVSIPLTMHR